MASQMGQFINRIFLNAPSLDGGQNLIKKIVEALRQQNTRGVNGEPAGILVGHLITFDDDEFEYIAQEAMNSMMDFCNGRTTEEVLMLNGPNFVKHCIQSNEGNELLIYAALVIRFDPGFANLVRQRFRPTSMPLPMPPLKVFNDHLHFVFLRMMADTITTEVYRMPLQVGGRTRIRTNFWIDRAPALCETGRVGITVQTKKRRPQLKNFKTHMTVFCILPVFQESVLRMLEQSPDARTPFVLETPELTHFSQPASTSILQVISIALGRYLRSPECEVKYAVEMALLDAYNLIGKTELEPQLSTKAHVYIDHNTVSPILIHECIPFSQLGSDEMYGALDSRANEIEFVEVVADEGGTTSDEDDNRDTDALENTNEMEFVEAVESEGESDHNRDADGGDNTSNEGEGFVPLGPVGAVDVADVVVAKVYPAELRIGRYAGNRNKCTGLYVMGVMEDDGTFRPINLRGMRVISLSVLDDSFPPLLIADFLAGDFIEQGSKDMTKLAGMYREYVRKVVDGNYSPEML